jgi:hypothetical protein
MNSVKAGHFNGGCADIEIEKILGWSAAPFNASYDEYLIEKKNLNLYKNPKRLAFIASWAEKELTE